MRAVYSADCQCDLIASGSAFPGIEVHHYQDEERAIAVFREMELTWHCGGGVDCRWHYDHQCRWHSGRGRYLSVHGSKGHIIAVVGSSCDED